MLRTLVVTGTIAAAAAFAAPPSAHALTGSSPYCVYNSQTRVITCRYSSMNACQTEKGSSSNQCLTRAQAMTKEKAGAPTTGQGGMQRPMQSK